MSPTDQTTPEEPTEPERGEHEGTDVDPTVIAWWAGGIVLAIVLCSGALAVFYAAIYDISIGSVFEPVTEQIEAPPPPEPRLEADPYALKHEAEAAAREQLDNYSWIEPEENIAQIPIERAMELVVERYRGRQQGGGPAPSGNRPGGPPDAGGNQPDAGSRNDSGEIHPMQ